MPSAGAGKAVHVTNWLSSIRVQTGFDDENRTGPRDVGA